MANKNKVNIPEFEVLNIDGIGPDYNPIINIFASYKSEHPHNSSGDLSGHNRYTMSKRGIWAASITYKGELAVLIQSLPMEFPPRCYLEVMLKGKDPCTIYAHHMEKSVLDIVPRGEAKKRLHELARKEAEDYLDKGRMQIELDYDIERILEITRINDFISGEILEAKEEIKSMITTSRMKKEFSHGLNKEIYRL